MWNFLGEQRGYFAPPENGFAPPELSSMIKYLVSIYTLALSQQLDSKCCPRLCLIISICPSWIYFLGLFIGYLLSSVFRISRQHIHHQVHPNMFVRGHTTCHNVCISSSTHDDNDDNVKTLQIVDPLCTSASIIYSGLSQNSTFSFSKI